MKAFLEELKTHFKGEIYTDFKRRHAYSHDASIYELTPDVALAPIDSDDIKHLVRLVTASKHLSPGLSITARGAGTNMSGGAIGSSIVIDMAKHFTDIRGVQANVLHAQPGANITDSIGTIGGMVANNSAGKQWLRYGNIDAAVRELSVILADGNEYIVKPIGKRELDIKMKQKNFEGAVYRRVYELIESNYDLVKNARPRSTKNSMGYNLWSVWDRDTGIFDLTQLFTGSQGTLGVITDVKIQTTPQPAHSGSMRVYLAYASWLGSVIPLVMRHNPASFKGLGSTGRLGKHLPGLVLTIGFDSDTDQQVGSMLANLKSDLHNHNKRIKIEIKGNESESAVFWTIHRANINLLQEKSENSHPAYFIDDMAIPTHFASQFYREINQIAKKNKLSVVISGHFGDGSFHITPLIDASDIKRQLKLEPVMRELIPYVIKYRGTLAGENNDGMIRGPWLPAIFGHDMYELFKTTKEIFDPLYIFNPHKKTDADWEYSMNHIRSKL